MKEELIGTTIPNVVMSYTRPENGQTVKVEFVANPIGDEKQYRITNDCAPDCPCGEAPRIGYFDTYDEAVALWKECSREWKINDEISRMMPAAIGEVIQRALPVILEQVTKAATEKIDAEMG